MFAFIIPVIVAFLVGLGLGVSSNGMTDPARGAIALWAGPFGAVAALVVGIIVALVSGVSLLTVLGAVVVGLFAAWGGVGMARVQLIAVMANLSRFRGD